MPVLAPVQLQPTPDAGGSDVFVHFSGIAGTGHRSLEEGQLVEFEIAQGKKGAEARDVVQAA